MVYNTKKSYFLIKNISICAFFLFILSGCIKSTPTESVVDNHVNHIHDVLDYSYNNIEQNKDVIFLQNELKSCELALIDVKQTYYGEISTCKAKTDYWRLATTGLFIALVDAFFIIIKRW